MNIIIKENNLNTNNTNFHNYKFSKSFNNNMYQDNGMKSPTNKEEKNKLWRQYQKSCQLEERLRTAEYQRKKLEREIIIKKNYLLKERERMRKIALEQAKEDAAYCIQKNWKCYRARFFLGANLSRLVRQRASVTLQCWWRKQEAKKVINNLKEIKQIEIENIYATKIQSVYRMHLVKKNKKEYEKSLHVLATKIQALWRGHHSRLNFNAKDLNKDIQHNKSVILVSPRSIDENLDNNSVSPVISKNDPDSQWLRIGGGFTNVPNDFIYNNSRKSKIEIAREYERTSRMQSSRRSNAWNRQLNNTKYDEMQNATTNSFSKAFLPYIFYIQ